MKIELIPFDNMPYPPRRSHYNDAGADVVVPKTTYIPAHNTVKIPLGFGLKIPDGFTGFIFPRSSWASQGVICQLPPIDSGYRGEVNAIVTNTGDFAVTVKAMERIGQLVILPIIIPEFVEDLSNELSRGADGFGSTGGCSYATGVTKEV